ncbi:unnamed protein product [Somion occarium]|uniref:DUF6533 domain-containing protein n=1 Tax=Somion occarium TaxID=3059160 RepID=A0ABP1CEY0_9APHY
MSTKWLIQIAGSANVEQMVVVVQTRQYVHFCEAATTFWLLYDWVISMGDEIELIWTSANTTPKFLYFISRYFGLVTQFVYVTDAMPLYCRTQLIFRTFTYYVLHVSVELSLLIRIYALWNQSKKVAIILASVFGLVQAANIVMLVIAETVMIGPLVPYPSNWPINGCFVLSNPRFFRACWIPILVFETLLFVMNTMKCLSYRPLSRTPLVVRLFRDGTIYYALMCVVLLLRTFSQYRSNLLSNFVTDTFMTAVFSYAGSALMLSIRSLAAERDRLTNIIPNLSEITPIDPAVSGMPSMKRPIQGRPLSQNCVPHGEPVSSTAQDTSSHCHIEETRRSFDIHSSPAVLQDISAVARTRDDHNNASVVVEMGYSRDTMSLEYPKWKSTSWLDDWNVQG